MRIYLLNEYGTKYVASVPKSEYCERVALRIRERGISRLAKRCLNETCESKW